MADTTGQAEIRGIDVDKFLKGFADEEFVMKNFVNMATTNSREIRWYQKTAGVLDSSATTGMTASRIANVAPGAKPEVIAPSFTRNTSYVRKYFATSELITLEDERDCDPDVVGTIIRDVPRAIDRQRDIRIYNIVTDNVSGTAYDGTSVPSAAAAGGGWAVASADPIGDMTSAKKSIRSYNYDPQGAAMFINQAEEKKLVDWIINTKGSMIPNFSSERVKDGVVMGLAGFNIVVNSFCTAGVAAIMVPHRACTYKEFVPLTTEVVREPGIGKRVLAWTEGEAYLTDPNACYGITTC